MRAISHILTAAFLAGCVAAQNAPASQTVKPAQPAPAKTASSSKSAVNSKAAAKSKSVANTKTAAKSPFAPKAKTSSTAPAKAVATHAAVKTVPGAQKPVTAKTPATPSVATAKPQGKAAPKLAAPAKTSAKAAPKVQPKKHEETKAAVKVAPPAPASEKKPEATPAVVQSEPTKLPSPGKRDPFLSPLAMAAARSNSASCTTGKKCLAVDQILLKGIVQMKGGNLALVENGAKRPYVLHENDSLFNGAVVKITGDSIILREEGSDILGRPVSKEVVKKVSAPAV